MEIIGLCKNLAGQQVKYLICGGLALNLYGAPSTQTNSSFILDFSHENITRFSNAIEPLGYQAHIPVTLIRLVDENLRKQLIETKNLIAYSFFSRTYNLATLDVLVEVPFDFEVLWQAREVRQAGNVAVNLVSVEHLVGLKLHSNRLQDKLDIESLKKIFPDRF